MKYLPSRTTIRWTLVIIFPFFLMWALMLLFTSVARHASNGSLTLTATAFWLALVPTIFAITMLVSLFLAYCTWKASTDQKNNWKQFWNIVEVVWLLGSGVGVFNLILSQAAILIPFASSSYREEALALLPALNRSAEEAKASFCAVEMVDARGCALIERIALTSELNQNFQYMGELSAAARRLQREQPAHPAIVPFLSLERSLFDYWEIMGFANRELHTRLNYEWMKKLLLFTPHIFAFVFPLRFGRALAAFRL